MARVLHPAISLSWLAAAVALLALPLPVAALEPLPKPPPIATPEEVYRQSVKSLPVEKVAPGVFRMGSIQINKKERSVSFPVQVNMDRGLLEYLLVRSSGKTHESLLRTEVEPYHLQIALLLLDLEVTDRPLPYQGAPETPQGAALEISFSFSAGDGKTQRVRAEEWVVRRDAEGKEAPQSHGRLDWVFTGSRVIEGRFMAQTEGSIVAIYHDPLAMIDNATPGGESDKIWFVREGPVPPPGTHGTITIRAL